MPGDLTTPDDIAAAMDGEITAHTVRRLCREGKFPGAVLAGRSWVIPLPAAEQFLRTYERYAHNTVAPAPAPGPGGGAPTPTPRNTEDAPDGQA